MPAVVHRDRYELSESTETRVHEVHTTEHVIKEGVLRRIRWIRVLVGVFITSTQGYPHPPASYSFTLLQSPSLLSLHLVAHSYHYRMWEQRGGGGILMRFSALTLHKSGILIIVFWRLLVTSSILSLPG